MSTRKPKMLRIIRISPGPVAPTGGSNEQRLGMPWSDQQHIPSQAQDSLRLPFPKRLGIQDLANGEMKMSPHAVNDLASSFVQMAKAFEELPGVRDELAEARSIIDEQQVRVQRLELRLMERATEIADLHSQVRAAEVARDDAELRFLEAEDRTEKAVAFVRTVFGNAGQLIQALEPPKPASEASEPQVQATGETPLPNSETWVNVESSPPSQVDQQDTGSTSSSEGSGEPHPFGDQGGGMAQPVITGTANVDSQSLVGQSDPNPSATTTQTEASEPLTAISNGAEPIASVQSGDGPYSGLKYYDQPFSCDLDKWIAGGGTEENYRWRPWHPDNAA